MMTKLFNEMILRPWSACVSSMEMLSKDVSLGMRIDAALSRGIHNLCRAMVSHDLHSEVVQSETNQSGRS